MKQTSHIVTFDEETRKKIVYAFSSRDIEYADLFGRYIAECLKDTGLAEDDFVTICRNIITYLSHSKQTIPEYKNLLGRDDSLYQSCISIIPEIRDAIFRTHI